MPKIIKLKNDLKLILVPMSGTKAITSLVLFGTGSRYEPNRLAGIAHFLEHMFFKGTKKRPTTFEIAKVIDGVGGEFNAFTGKEYTGYYTKVAAGHFAVGLELLADLLQNSLFDPAEMNRERGVVLEEMKMYFDNPMAYIESVFEQMLYPGQPLGRDTIGTPETLTSIKREDFLSFIRDHYFRQNAIIVIAGAIANEDQMVKTVENNFQSLLSHQRQKPDQARIDQTDSHCQLVTKKTEQTHLALGVRTFSIHHPDRYALSVLSSFLGEGMSSRLFIKIREREGLAYYVRSMLGHFTDDGYLYIQAGIDHSKIVKVIQIIIAEFMQLRDGKIEDDEIARSKEYIKGKTWLRMEDSEDQANFYALQTMLEGTNETIAERLTKIDQVQKEDIVRVAQEIFQNNRLNLALISSHKSDVEMKKYLSF